MARPLSSQKYTALINATISTLAENGLSATTANIAKRAKVAVGTLFTYFPTKEQLFNDVYLLLKSDMAERLVTGYPKNADVHTQIKHVWSGYTEWALKNPNGKRVLRLLSVSELLTPETLAKTPEPLVLIDQMFTQAIKDNLLVSDEKDFIYNIFQNISDATSEQIEKQPERKDALLQLGFEIMWKAISA
ncbi:MULTISPECIES: TetR/AcrR family transcriptional regulator [Providencia]|uniref:TetR/AcrR family transcriptional regulator n=1 Tax=Providencia TaxID=586 RepID=UPI00197DC2B0|nr:MULTISPECIES: TetR/AcrR family transcriptional regulator [Providencia]MBN4865911.1 TetR/AcrR family transcriptional regulator [Providencia stuartii]MBN4875233.1 TetR/AcrR family transcriptional regulator [Providencia stuartii]MBN4879924.1 TetR/AcrR family transcriptional regulator [Providencia stuartii]MBN4884555.1 TetR/AcrR family transcriptional regulator [Providencia stuartii]HEM8293824.1 TetR/AcrR family transcriptional regulator [Providencia stuartii]